ncbi:MAG: CheR family methyltransferase, partial [Spirochaetota bacterium]
MVDIFFDSLAQELGSRAAAVILSGTGTDGSNGIKKIKAGEGVVLAQSLKTASYTGMPQSAMETGVVDSAAAPEDMPDKLRQHFVNEGSRDDQHEDNDYALSKIFAILYHKLGHDFSDHKETTLRRRLQRRLTFNEIDSYEAYLPVLRQNRQEALALFREFLIGVTHFFRDPESLEALKQKVLPDLIRTAGEGETLRVWVAGCSTGEEAYSIAIIFHEVMDTEQKAVKLQVFGTDLDEQAVETARGGLYPSTIAADVDETRLSRFFRKEGESYRVRKGIRESIVFSGQDLLSDPPFSRLHMVCCRNVLIYLKPGAQKRLLPLFHYTLNQGGILVLGSSESIGSHTALFSAVDQKQKIFQKKEVSAQVRGELKFPTGVGKLERALPGSHDEPEDQGKSKSTAELTQRVLLDEFAPTAVLVEPDGRIIHIQGKTGRYLEAVTGPPTYNILDLAKQGLRLEIASALRAARTDGKPIDRREIRVRNQDNREIVDLHVRPLSKPDELAGRILIVFEDREDREETKSTSQSPEQLGEGEHESRIAELEMELQHTRESHQSTVEELESANEELKSTNEELQSTNEELQSTNEENESSKEELHALNEELQTANDQLEQKMTDLNAVNDDIRNLLNSTDVASVFVDEHINVRRFTPEATRIIKLIE